MLYVSTVSSKKLFKVLSFTEIKFNVHDNLLQCFNNEYIWYNL